MRIIAGRFRGTQLHTFSGRQIRPTSDRLRESIFNIIGPCIRGQHVLDLFAGTGAMGIEALSRGAKHAVFIDNNAQALELIHRNLSKLRVSDRATVIRWDIACNLNCLTGLGKSDIVFIDPPYRKDLLRSALDHLHKALTNRAMIVIEHDMNEPLDVLPAGISLGDQRRYGKTLVSFLDSVL